MLATEIADTQRSVRTDAYPMSLGEITSMYESAELDVNPDFQRLFRWTPTQKSRLIESILLGIPLPSIFVFEREDGTWELIDGLQRLSTILEFMGKLRNPDGGFYPPSFLEATSYLPSLHNTVWEESALIEQLPIGEQVTLEKAQQLAIRRARIGVEILKRPSDNNTKFDLFQRLNAGGTQANAQELRNCIMIMVNAQYFRDVREQAETETFLAVTKLNDDQTEKQRHLEFATRILVHALVPYDEILDVEEYVDKGAQILCEIGDGPQATRLLSETMRLLSQAAGSNALRRFQDNRFVGRVGLVAIEGIAVGVARNLDAILLEADPAGFVRQKIESFWDQPQIVNFTSPGLRGTVRIARTVPFGDQWFKP